MSSIGKGVLVFAGVSEKDTRREVEAMASKVLKMKMWPDEHGANVCMPFSSLFYIFTAYCSQWKQNVQEIRGEVLCGMLID